MRFDEDQRWMADAACAHAVTDLWFPERGEPAGPAKLVCAGCPVREECLDYALVHDEPFGIWGGTSERERKQIRRRRRAAA